MAVYLFFDESGNLDFSKKGTPYYAFGCLTTRNPESLFQPLSALRYELLEDGIDLEGFHASEDRQAVRNKVFEVIASVSGLEFDAVVVAKNNRGVEPVDPVLFYSDFAAVLLRRVFRRYRTDEKIILVTDRIPPKRKRDAVEKAFKTFVKHELGSRPFAVMHHASTAHLCLQAADYCMWAVYKKWAAEETRPYDLIKHLLRSEVAIDHELATRGL